MSEVERELRQLRQEIVESRNQAIKTDNQVRNLTLDIRAFEQRFDGIDRRVRLTHLGVYGLLTLVVACAAGVVTTVRSKSYEEELQQVRAASSEAHELDARQTEALKRRLDDAERSKRAYSQASDVAARIFDLLDRQQEGPAGDLLDALQVGELTPLERRLANKRLEELRRRSAEAAYRMGRQAALTGRHDAAIVSLRRALSLQANGRVAAPSRYMLAGSLYSSHQYEQAEPLWRALRKSEDPAIVHEATYFHAAALAHLGKREEASKLFGQLLRGDHRFVGASRAYLSALQNGFELPTDLPGGRIRLSKLAAAAAPPVSAPVAVPAPAPAPVPAPAPADGSN